MNTTELTYPVFEANQVLTNAHLNELFEYLDEQQRLTRANLIGVGIACGLVVQLAAPGTITVSKGVGVSTQGYLIMEPADIDLVAVRSYKLPTEYGYAPFVDPSTAKQYDLWELFPDDEPDTQPLADSGLVLNDKAVVLFLELRKGDLRTCSPNSCDDRGAQVTAAVRRLLIDVTDLDKVIAATNGHAATTLGQSITERLALPDLRMPRFDVPSSGPAAAEEVLAAFQATFRHNQLAARTADALTKLYESFKPLVDAEHPNNPFATFLNRFGFLDASPVTTAQVRFMQYYWDLFDDLLAAYEELRSKGIDLMCACCPPEGWFPRHLVAGVLAPATFDAADYRHHFVPSPAVGDCEDRTREVRILFRRLVAMLEHFTETPALPPPANAGPDPQIRIIPSRWGDAALSAKAIPYYYAQDGSPRLYEVWDPDKVVRQRPNHNLGYRADEYTPPAPAFVSDPLRFDLEPNNFLRIEGHLGKNVEGVVQTLLSLKKSHRLPFEVVALRTGVFDENIDIDLSKEDCRFQDLETLFETLKSELIGFVVKQVQYFYAIPSEVEAGEDEAVPTLSVLRTWAPDSVARPGTLGRRFEAALTWQPGQPQPMIFTVVGTPDLQSQAFALVQSMSELAASLTDDISQLDFTTFAGRHRRLVEIAKQIDDFRRNGAFDEPGLADRLDDIVFRCRLDPFEALAEEHKRRVRDVKQAQFLSNFLERHPGVQHKAGVPLGGTFIVVYHALSKPVRPAPQPETGPAPGLGGLASFERAVSRRGLQFDEVKTKQVSEALSRLQYKQQVAADPDVQFVYRVFTGNLLVPKVATSGFTDETYLRAVADLADGTVIADFFLPYECCSECSPIQCTPPSGQLRVKAQKACTNSDGFAEVTLVTEGGSGSVSVQVDGGTFEESTGTLLLDVGDHTIVVRDETGAQSSPVEVVVPPQLLIDAAQTTVDQAAGTFQVVFEVAGGTAPYVADPGTIAGTTYTSPALPVAQILTVAVKDAAGCVVEGTFESGVEPCMLPCEGAAERRGYRFWIPEARQGLPLNNFRAEVRRFEIFDPDGNPMDATNEVNEILNTVPSVIRAGDFPAVVQRWLDHLNRLIAEIVGSDQWLIVDYEPAPEGATTGTLWVDRITCVDFRLEFGVEFVQGQVDRQFELEYGSDGTVVLEPSTDSKVHIPPFGGSTSNKCHPEEPPVPICGQLDLELEVEREGVFPDEEVVLTAIAPWQPAAYLWEVQDGIPSMAGGEQVVLRFEPAEPVTKRVRLTAFTEDGCTVVLETAINIVEPDA